jgi:hypothetical protein
MDQWQDIPGHVHGEASHLLARPSRTSSVHVFDDANNTDLEDIRVRKSVVKWLRKQQNCLRTKMQTSTARDFLGAVLPCLSWITGYSVRSCMAASRDTCIRRVGRVTMRPLCFCIEVLAAGPFSPNVGCF